MAVQRATTCGNISGGASSGAIERRDGASIASAAPNTNAIANKRPHRSRSELAVDHETDGTQRPGEQEERRDPTAVEPVGDPPADQHEHHGGDELGETDESDGEGVAGDVERLLEQHRDQDVHPDRGERRRQQVSPHG